MAVSKSVIPRSTLCNKRMHNTSGTIWLHGCQSSHLLSKCRYFKKPPFAWRSPCSLIRLMSIVSTDVSVASFSVAKTTYPIRYFVNAVHRYRLCRNPLTIAIHFIVLFYNLHFILLFRPLSSLLASKFNNCPFSPYIWISLQVVAHCGCQNFLR